MMHTKESIMAAIDALPVEPEISADALYLVFYKANGAERRIYRILDTTVLHDPAIGTQSMWSGMHASLADYLIGNGFICPPPAMDDDFAQKARRYLRDTERDGWR